MISAAYRAQVDLLLRILLYVAKENCFALKGGTAINLFVRDMPRFSVDIDLTYMPLEGRAEALGNISGALARIKDELENSIPGLVATAMPQTEGQDAKLVCRLQQATVKIEVNTIMRGHLWPARLMQLAQTPQYEFGKFAEINVVSHADLFGGKICAALDRQHPRDIFDVHQLFENEGLSDEVRLGFLTSLLSHSRPLHEIIRPNLQDQRAAYAGQFAGMTIQAFTYDDFEATRRKLVADINDLLTDADRAFLLSFKTGDPDWTLFPIEALQTMPAIQWKLANIRKLKANAQKHAAQLKALEKALSGD